jgi:hypothetical protein
MPAQIRATAIKKRRTRGSIFIKKRTGIPLAIRIRRIRKIPPQTPRIRAIISNQVYTLSSFVEFVGLLDAVELVVD